MFLTKKTKQHLKKPTPQYFIKNQSNTEGSLFRNYLLIGMREHYVRGTFKVPRTFSRVRSCVTQIGRSFLRVKRIFSLITRLFSLITRPFSFITRPFSFITRAFLFITRLFSFITRPFSFITRLFYSSHDRFDS